MILHRQPTKFLFMAVVVGAVAAAPLLAQGTQTGTIRGTVTLVDGSPAPGVAVTATSPAELGANTAYTGETGQYILRGLTPGEYKLTFVLEGMSTVESTATVNLGQTTPLDVTLEPQEFEESIVVTGDRSSVLAGSTVSTTYTARDIESLPIARTPSDVAALAPGLTTNTPNDGQVTISGGFAYDNVFLIDGVDANDNLFGTSNPVYIEEAVADIQVLTSGISAEYGRFSGGVVNIITKSGGNQFTGSARADLENEDWRNRTPVEERQGTELVDDIKEFYSATLGGYIVQDRLWFFAAGRDESTSGQDTLAATGLPEPTSTEEDRYEGKLTLNIVDRHQLQGQYTEREQTGQRASFNFSATPDTLRTRTDPSDLLVARYNGALTDSLFGELQYSEKTFGFRNTHGDEGLVESSPFFSTATAPFVHYHAPYFDGTDPEDRNNEQASGALSWFMDTTEFGSHDLKFGAEDFTSFRTGGNSQSPTNFVFYAPPVQNADGSYFVNENQEMIPRFVPDTSFIANWIPTRGAEIEINTLSLYVNDQWRLNEHWSLNIGARYEDVESEATGGIVTVSTDRIVPRLGATYDVLGDGKYRVQATYGQYSGKYSESQFAENTTVGNPRGIFSVYTGPEGQGYDFAPGFDLSNYVPFAADDGTANVFVADGISSPVVTEWTLGGGLELVRGGYLRAVYTNREYDDFVEDFVCAAAAGIPCVGPGDTGTTEVVVEGVSAGTFNNTIVDNSDVPTREYEALQLLGRYVLTDRWDVQGSWTYQLTNEGNFEGEGVNTPGVSSFFGDFPGYHTADRHFPAGDLNDFQEHKIRAWTTYRFDLGRAGDLSASLLANYSSGTTFSFTDEIPRGFSPIQQSILASYLSLPDASQEIYFGERGAGEFPSYTTFDFGLVYDLPIVADWGLDLFIDFDMINILDEDKAIEFNTDIISNLDGPTDANGLPTEFQRAETFGEGLDNEDFADPREYRIGVGIRF